MLKACQPSCRALNNSPPLGCCLCCLDPMFIFKDSGQRESKFAGGFTASIVRLGCGARVLGSTARVLNVCGCCPSNWVVKMNTPQGIVLSPGRCQGCLCSCHLLYGVVTCDPVILGRLRGGLWAPYGPRNLFLPIGCFLSFRSVSVCLSVSVFISICMHSQYNSSLCLYVCCCLSFSQSFCLSLSLSL